MHKLFGKNRYYINNKYIVSLISLNNICFSVHLLCFLFRSHQYCTFHRSTFQHFWWRNTSGALFYFIRMSKWYIFIVYILFIFKFNIWNTYRKVLIVHQSILIVLEISLHIEIKQDCHVIINWRDEKVRFFEFMANHEGIHVTINYQVH
jgi:hypothetical protein